MPTERRRAVFALATLSHDAHRRAYLYRQGQWRRFRAKGQPPIPPRRADARARAALAGVSPYLIPIVLNFGCVSKVAVYTFAPWPGTTAFTRTFGERHKGSIVRAIR